MRPEVKEAWVAALRSGKYEQGTNVLRSKDNKFCCLGVLCDISPYAKDWSLNGNSYNIGAENAWKLLPTEVEEWAEFDDSFQLHISRDGELDQWYSLFALNDGGKHGGMVTFAEIADLIEAQL